MDEDEFELTPQEENPFYDGIGIFFLGYFNSYLLDLELLLTKRVTIFNMISYLPYYLAKSSLLLVALSVPMSYC